MKKYLFYLLISMLLLIIFSFNVNAGRQFLCLNTCEKKCLSEYEQAISGVDLGDNALQGGVEEIYLHCIEPCFFRCDKKARKSKALDCRHKWDNELNKCLSKDRISWKVCWKLWRKNAGDCYKK